MKKILLLLLLQTAIFAEVINLNVSKDFIQNTNMKIIDIRTKQEWKETGIIKGSYPIEFFNARGQYNVQDFLNKLNQVVNKNEKFAIICRTGSRTRMVSQFLGNKLGYKVVNLNGGIMSLQRQGFKLSPYQ